MIRYIQPRCPHPQEHRQVPIQGSPQGTPVHVGYRRTTRPSVSHPEIRWLRTINCLRRTSFCLRINFWFTRSRTSYYI